MAGLNFQTQTIINSNLDPDSGKVLFEKGKLFGEDHVGHNPDVLKVKRDFIFAKDEDGLGKVLAIRKAEGHDAVACKAVIDFTKVTEALVWAEGETKKYCRLDIYLGVEGAEPYIYSTPWVQKGMPFWVEFTVVKGQEAKVAETVANMIKKNHLFLVDKDLINVEVASNKLTLTGNTEYQRFRKVEVLTFSATADDADVVATLGDAAIALEERGKNSFGTYSQIVKDLRLPTAANYQWTHVRQVETPIVGAIYNQYIIEYCAPAVNDGLHAVGQRMDSHTTHVFWVNQEVAGEWETALAVIDPDGGALDAENVASELDV
jgi:hypothetical protein